MLDNLEPLLRMFWLIAIPASVVFLLQTIMTFISAGGDDGSGADLHDAGNGSHHNGDGSDSAFQVFTLRNLINFLLGFAWTGISFYKSISSPTVLILVSLAIGCVFVYLFFMIARQVQKLAEDNSFKLADTLNKTAEVYLTIPANKQGKGKVILSVKGAVHELEAMTEKDKLDSNTVVKVVKVENNNILIVEKI